MNISTDSHQSIREEILQPVDEMAQTIAAGLCAWHTNLFRKEPWRSSMLSVAVQTLNDVSILHCRGQILFGDATLYQTALSQKKPGTLVLDLAQVSGIDAGGLGVLLDLRAWAHSNGIQFKLMNVVRPVQQVLDLTRLNLVFDICSVHEMFHLLARANGIDAPPGRRTDSSNTPDRKLPGSDGLQQSGN